MNFDGVLILVSHDRAFSDKVTDHLFVFEGNGVVKDFQGSLSEYASCLVELENQKIQSQIGTSTEEAEGGKKATYKEDKEKRNELRNFVRGAKKEMKNIENATEKLKAKADKLQMEIDNSGDEGWTVLADLTDQLNAVKDEIDEKELRWLELAEELEEVEVEL